MSLSIKSTARAAAERFRTPLYSVDPTPGDLELMRVVAIYQYLLGGLTLLAATVLIDEVDMAGGWAFFGLGLAGLALAGIRIVNPGSMTLGYARFSNVAGVIFIGVVVAVARPIGATPAFYLWPMLTAAYFLCRRDLMITSVLFAVSFATATAVNDIAAGAVPLTFIPIVMVVLIVTALVRLMREALALQTADLERAASIDELTGLSNRSTVRRALHREIDRARRIEAPLSVCLFDLDHFKSVNDRLGHAGGDRALRRVAALLADECRGGDLPSRYGGEEFLVLMPDTAIGEATACAERLRQRIQTATMGEEAMITISAGVAELGPTDRGPDDVIQAADEALYEAKGGGRNRVVVAHRHRVAAQPELH